MPIATGLALGLGLAGALGGSAIGALGATSAAGTQANAADQAAALQAQEAQNSLDFQKQVFNTTQQNEAPFLQAGQGAVGNLSQLLGIGQAPQGLGNAPAAPGALPVTSQPGPTNPSGGPQSELRLAGQPLNGAGANLTTPTNIGGVNYNLQNGGGSQFGSLAQPWNSQFQAPTAAQAAQTPGYQFALQQGEQALQNSASAQGGLLSGGTAKALEQYGQGLADTNYQQVYNNALGQYQQSYNQFQNNQSNQYNRLASLAGLGQTTASQLGSQNQSAANNISNTLLTSGQQIGQNINNAGAATASGYTGAANAAAGGVNALGQLGLLSQLLGGSNSAAAANNQFTNSAANLIGWGGQD